MDKGPWKVDVWKQGFSRYRKVVLQSDDFEHDVSLEISGEFDDWDQKMAYAQWLADVINRATVQVDATL